MSVGKSEYIVVVGFVYRYYGSFFVIVWLLFLVSYFCFDVSVFEILVLYWNI